MNKKGFISAVAELGTEKGLSKEIITKAIEEAFKITVNKKLSEELKVESKNKYLEEELKNNKTKKDKKEDKKEDKDKKEIVPEIKKLPNAYVRVSCDLDKAKLNVYYQRLVKLDEDIEDDFLEISLEEAKKMDPKIKVGDFYEEEINIDDFDKKDVDRFVSSFKQAISKYEKAILLEAFKDKIGHIVTGVVEKVDNSIVMVNLGKTSITLYKKNDLIGDEKFNTGDPIKVYILGIGKDDKKSSALIHASRSCPEFLEKIFENEVNEIYDKTVEIKKIARIAGKRSKVVVYSNDPNVDASGACIGKNGERIQRIVSQLGNSKDAKEKIDVVLYHKNLGVYLAEILKPADIVGINFSEDNKTAEVICRNDTGNLAIGSGHQNIRLAKMLTGLEEIKVFNESETEEKGITSYKPIETYILEDEEEEKEEAKRKFREENIKQTLAKKSIHNEYNIEEEIVPTLDEEVESVESVEEVPEVVEEESSILKAKKKEEVEVKEEPVKEKPVKKIEPVELKEVKTTTTLESLEKSLEEEKKAKEVKASKKSNKKKEEKTEEKAESKKQVTKMDVYTEEELAELEDEENEDYYVDDDDYSEYDSDDFYEDK